MLLKIWSGDLLRSGRSPCKHCKLWFPTKSAATPGPRPRAGESGSPTAPMHPRTVQNASPRETLLLLLLMEPDSPAVSKHSSPRAGFLLYVVAAVSALAACSVWSLRVL